jgi:hypothetical protein
MRISIDNHKLPVENQDMDALVLSTEVDHGFEIRESILRMCDPLSHEGQYRWEPNR